MSCKDTMVTNIHTLKEDATIRAALAALQEKRVRSMPVVDGTGRYLGLFNFRALMTRLLPASAGIPGGLQSLAFVSEDMDYTSRRLRDILDCRVSEVMRTDIPVLRPETVFDEALLQLHIHDTPLPVVDRGTGKLLGLFSKQSAVSALMERVLKGGAA